MKKEEIFIVFLFSLIMCGLFFYMLDRILVQSNKAMFYYHRFQQVGERNIELQYKWERARVEKYELEEKIKELK